MQKNPVVASVNTPRFTLLQMMSEKIRHIPILNERGEIVDLASYLHRLVLPVAEPEVGDRELEYVTECITSNWISSVGKFVTQFEEEFARFCGTKYAVATSNGTVALHLALVVLGIGAGDEVIVPTLTFIATANAVTYTGARPVFVDSERYTWNIDPEKIEAAITPRTKAIIPVHLYGHPADMGPILKLAKKYHLYVIEDAAEAHGALCHGQTVGSIGDMGCFSFFGNKIITTGEGGMITTNNKEFAQKAKMLRDHGVSPDKKYWHPIIGFNYRLTNVQAAIGVAQLEKIDRLLERKREIAGLYRSLLKDVAGITQPPEASWAKNVFWMYSILVEKEYGMSRDDLIARLGDNGVDSRPVFYPIHTMPPYKQNLVLPVAEELASKGISLPSGIGLRDEEIERVASLIKK
ncbi:GDP-perosamine synthase [subsurface metagenome]